mmetsp:Transcript_30712/g.72639  ORF Transcript_30712/g.72639 Transcript_30712/m.72639 type:complete len:205 (-) Transcript_30712:641-1255(-)
MVVALVRGLAARLSPLRAGPGPLRCLLLGAADAVAVGLAVAVVLVALSDRAAAQLAAHRTVPLPSDPGAASLGVDVVADALAEAVLAEAPCAVLVAARQHPTRPHLYVLAEVAVLVVLRRLRRRRSVVEAARHGPVAHGLHACPGQARGLRRHVRHRGVVVPRHRPMVHPRKAPVHLHVPFPRVLEGHVGAEAHVDVRIAGVRP